MRELTSKSPIDSCQKELSPSDPIESVCQLFQPPSLLLTLTSGTTDQAPCNHFRFRSRSDSIRLRVKSTRLRLSVLDMYDNGSQFISTEYKYEYGFEHVTSSQYSPQGNGKIEAAVKTVKRMYQKNKDIHMALLDYRKSHNKDRNTFLLKGYSPAAQGVSFL